GAAELGSTRPGAAARHDPAADLARLPAALRRRHAHLPRWDDHLRRGALPALPADRLQRGGRAHRRGPAGAGPRRGLVRRRARRPRRPPQAAGRHRARPGAGHGAARPQRRACRALGRGALRAGLPPRRLLEPAATLARGAAPAHGSSRGADRGERPRLLGCPGRHAHRPRRRRTAAGGRRGDLVLRHRRGRAAARHRALRRTRAPPAPRQDRPSQPARHPRRGPVRRRPPRPAGDLPRRRRGDDAGDPRRAVPGARRGRLRPPRAPGAALLRGDRGRHRRDGNQWLDLARPPPRPRDRRLRRGVRPRDRCRRHGADDLADDAGAGRRRRRGHGLGGVPGHRVEPDDPRVHARTAGRDRDALLLAGAARWAGPGRRRGRPVVGPRVDHQRRPRLCRRRRRDRDLAPRLLALRRPDRRARRGRAAPTCGGL
ncbi:MAG: Uncharacterized MFS-type transporter, partial [uncultured Nocardioidaceae bacterium]